MEERKINVSEKVDESKVFQMNYASETFKARTKGLHPKLILWLGYMLATCPIDFFITEGVRTLERQQELYAQGRTVLKDKNGKPLPKVTNTDGIKYKSRHQIQASGYGHAVDIYYVGWTKDDNPKDKRWSILLEHGKLCAKMLGIKMGYGMEFKSLYDAPHYQLEEDM